MSKRKLRNLSNDGAAPVPQGYGMHCIGCRSTVSQMTPELRCPECGDLLEVIYPWLAQRGDAQHCDLEPSTLKTVWRERRLSSKVIDRSGVWRFRELLPILARPQDPVSLIEGNTPLYALHACASRLGLKRVLAKHQGMNSTGSFKDTGMTVAISVAREQGFRWVGCASTGNTSASMAAYAARAGMRSLVLVPEGRIASGKLAQTLEYGAVTCMMATDFDGCVRVMSEIIRRAPVYLLNSVNPFRVEGQKTAAIELAEQLDWAAPDHVIVPGGNLGNASALGKGFEELVALALIKHLPKISIIQAAGANPLVRCVRETAGEKLIPVRAETRATAIRIGNPASWKKAVEVLRATGGACEDVTDEEIAQAKAELAAEGIGCEPASAATLAGLKKLVRSGFVQPDDSVVLVLTGHSLKDPEYTLEAQKGQPANLPIAAEPSADSVLRILERFSY